MRLYPQLIGTDEYQKNVQRKLQQGYNDNTRVLVLKHYPQLKKLVNEGNCWS